MRPSASESAIQISHSGRPRTSRVEIADHVVAEVEVVVVDPDRLAQPERHLRDLLSEARRLREARLDPRPQLHEPRGRPALRGVEAGGPTEMHVG